MPARLLVVDDEPDMEALCLQRFRKRIRAGELSFEFVSNGALALRALDADPAIDVVLTDINMPEMNGLTLLGKIQELHRPLKTIVISAYGDMQNIRTAMNRGAFDFLLKPIDFDDLTTTIEKTIQIVGQLKDGLEAQQRTRELEDRNRFVREVFGRYVSEQVVTRLLDAPEGLQLGGERRRVTTMMVDVRGFTALAERLGPEDVVFLLNKYLKVAVDIIHKYDGTINEIMGDGLLVFFGAPIARGDEAKAAIASAVELQIAVDRLNYENLAAGLPGMRVGIGIHSGMAVVGNIGSEKRSKYAAVGSSVNLACRIESHTVGGQILISEATKNEAEPDVQVGRRIEILAKGVSTPIPVYEVRGIDGRYGLVMPDRTDDQCCMPVDAAIGYAVVDGKTVGTERQDGVCIRLSDRLAIIRATVPPAPHSNLKLWLQDGGGQAMAGECYGKALHDGVRAEGCFAVIYTYADPDFLSSVSRVLDRVAPEVAAGRCGARTCEDRLWCNACDI